MTGTPEGDLDLLFQIWVTLVGLAFGSFLNVCIARMPEDRSVAHPPSHCPACGHKIRWYENIPVVSWVVLRARCSGCGTRISPLYPTIELMMGALSLLLYRHLVETPTLENMGAWALYLLFVFILVGSTFIDIRHYIIPDEFSIFAVPVGFFGVMALDFGGYEGPNAMAWQSSAYGALAGGGVLLLTIGAWWLVRRVEAMGFGDVKLLAMMGAFLGAAPAVPFILVMACFLGSAVGLVMMVRRGGGLSTQVPFGPFLAASGVIYLFFGEAIIRNWLPTWSFVYG
ncbi:MAG: prepilin peptidase [Proteobacteria bacterium]|nr:prepilin peptidase [Pseudomonadota bacterium]MCP4917317.1 prepilin peptidase [Pseudomonadota bacterium]